MPPETPSAIADLSPEHLRAILEQFPDPVFLLTRSGRYAAIYGGTDTRYYHDGSSLIGRSLRDVLKPEKAEWFLAEIARALDTRRLNIIEYGLSNRDVIGLEEEPGPAEPIWFEGRVQAMNFPIDGEEAVLWVASNISERVGIRIQLTDALRREREAIDVLWRRIAAAHSAPAEGRWTLDVAAARLMEEAGKTVALTANETQLLACLAEACGAVIDKEAIGARLFPGNDGGCGGRIDVIVSRLRGKLSREGCDLVIRSVFGKGLALTEPVRLAGRGHP